jgi:hypothetical protein
MVMKLSEKTPLSGMMMVRPRLGLGRIVASEIEAPNMLVDLV